MIKTVLTAAGKGTRLLPFTKEMPKEMMPIFSSNTKQRNVSPLLQYVYEQLYSMNFRDYCFVVGREKRSIEDHFTPHETYLRDLNGNYKSLIRKFYGKLEKSHLVWINQNKPIGFGDAVKRAERYVGNEDFIMHAGDFTILSKKKNHPVLRLIKTAKENPDAKAILLCKKVHDSKRYGVPTISKISDKAFVVKEVIEKPEKPKSPYGILALYYFKPDIFSSLKKIKPGKGNEFQLTDGIQNLIKNDEKVLAVTLDKDEYEIDVGSVESYKKAMEICYLRA